MNFLEKLDLLMKEKGISKSVLSKESGIPYTTIDGFYKKGYENAKLSTIKKLSRYFNITMDELIGDGVYQVNSNQNITNSTNQIKKMPDTFEKKYYSLDKYGQKTVNVVLDAEYERCNATKKQPVFTFRRLNANKASAGTGFDLNNPDEWKEIEVIDTPEARQADFAVEIEGESMEPDYYDGDIVYISLASEVRVGQVGLFIQNGKGYIKEAGNGCIISRNPKYDDIYPTDGDIECKGRVIGVAKLPD